MKSVHFAFEASRLSAGQPDQAKRWFDELEMTGPQNVRAWLAQSDAGSGGSIAMEAAEWLAWHDRRKAAAEAARHDRQIFGPGLRRFQPQSPA
jgi:hypothetical protein